MSADNGYSVEVDSVDKERWHELLIGFDDASFYQTWSYGRVRWGEENLSHVLLRKDGVLVSMAQLRIIVFPFKAGGVAYLPWGPLWRPRVSKPDLEHLRNMVIALKEEYVIRRGFLLRVLPKRMATSEDGMRDLYEAEGFAWRPDPQQSVFVNLSESLETIKKKLRRGWRRSLEASQKAGLEYIEGTDDHLFDEGLKIVQEMKKRKQFVEFKNMDKIRHANSDLPEDLKLRIVLCKHQGQAIAVLGWFPFGGVGYPILGGTTERALSLKASFPLWWRMIEYYKTRGSGWCDLAGVNEGRNPGGYLFKSGLGGADSVGGYVGEFEACTKRVSFILFKVLASLREGYRATRLGLNRVRGPGVDHNRPHQSPIIENRHRGGHLVPRRSKE